MGVIPPKQDASSQDGMVIVLPTRSRARLVLLIPNEKKGRDTGTIAVNEMALFDITIFTVLTFRALCGVPLVVLERASKKQLNKMRGNSNVKVRAEGGVKDGRKSKKANATASSADGLENKEGSNGAEKTMKTIGHKTNAAGHDDGEQKLERSDKIH